MITDRDIAILDLAGRFGACTLEQARAHLGKTTSAHHLTRRLRRLEGARYVRLERMVLASSTTATVISLCPPVLPYLAAATGRSERSWIAKRPKTAEIEHLLLHNDAHQAALRLADARGLLVKGVRTHEQMQADLGRQASSAADAGIIDFVLLCEDGSGAPVEQPVEVAIRYSNGQIQGKHRSHPEALWVTPSIAQARKIETITGRPPVVLQETLR